MACGQDMNSLFYAGLVAILDPPRPGCAQSIETVQLASVSVKMVTGDAMETATSIGRLLIYLNYIVVRAPPPPRVVVSANFWKGRQKVPDFFR
jgi:magnesium-transporting ATPase (P-type)